MAELPVLPLKTDALLADTSHMSAEEFGAYCRILFVMWRHGAKLPDDDKELAHIAGVSLARWHKIAEKVRRPMTAIGNVLSQKRLTDTWLQVQQVRHKRAQAAGARWGPKTDPPGVQKDMHVHKQMDMHKDMQMQSKWNANQNQIKNLSSSESVAARATPAEVPENQDKPAGSLATALSGGALTRPPDAEPAATKPKPPSEVTRDDWVAIFAAKRATKGRPE